MSASLDLEALRAQTPGVEHRVHFNNAGAALMPQPVLDAVLGHLELEARIGGYEAADERRADIRRAYESVAGLIGAQPQNIAVMENATAAFNGALSAFRFEAEDVLLTTRHDYVSNQIAFLSLQERFGIRVVRAPDAPEGGVDTAGLEELAHKLRPRVVTISHVPTNSGLVQPVDEVVAACRKRDIPVIVDACQSVGQLDVDVRKTDPDFLSVTARKFLRGPRGVGFLYVSDRALDHGLMPLFPDLQGADWIEEDLIQPAPDARRFENWEFPYALVLGLGEAADYATRIGMDAIEDRVTGLAASLRERLAALPGVQVHDKGARLSGLVTITSELRPAQALKDGLTQRGINTGVSPRAYAVLDFDDKGIEAALRISPHYYTTEREVDTLTHALHELVTE